MEHVIAEHIEITPGVCGGRPRIAGHRIRVQDVVVLHEHLGRTPDEIAVSYPGVSLADIYAALAYYFDHRDEIRRQMAEDDAFVEEQKSKTPSLLAEKLARRGRV
ncbi:MAG: DUF433 domain-containing protein [Planctomycetaceae bacterium]